MASTPAAAGVGALTAQAERRRTFAIVSHPDAGKTTTTEKLLLYAGALDRAGSVKARAGQSQTTSDWMEFERRRGISITATALQFPHGGRELTLLDTPGHHDFSEDTLRVMTAADCAVVLLDASRGIERQTARLLEVAQARRMPLLVFVNKCDRPGLEPLGLLDSIEAGIGVPATPLNWPVGEPGDFRGLIERGDDSFLRLGRTAHGATAVAEERITAERAEREEGPPWLRAREELELVESATLEFDRELFHGGEQAAILFGSAAWNFGVRMLLESVVELTPPPRPFADQEGNERPLEAPFSGFVFKVQANMDPRHRDNLAYLRICSGRFERGMRVTNARSGRELALNYPQQIFGRERSTLDQAWPGDVIGVVNAADLRVGDTVFSAEPVVFPPAPRLDPVRFAVARNALGQRHKQFERGLRQLDGEGLIQVLRRDPDHPESILAGLGELQFEAVAERMKVEFGVELRLEPMRLTTARRADVALAERLRGWPGAEAFFRSDGAMLAAFRDEFELGRFLERDRGAELGNDALGELLLASHS
ncbi:MAG: peptide chain release factor 3 [Solirubrobacterales bacterium]